MFSSQPLPQLVIDLHAPASSYTGQGVSIRNYLHYLVRRDLHIRLFDLKLDGGREEFDTRFAGLAHTPLDAPAPGALVRMGSGGVLPAPVTRYREGVQAAGRAAAFHLWWELPVMHPRAVDELDKFDAVIASTRFIADIARRHLRHAAILYAPQPLALADEPEPMPDRARFGIPPEAFAVLFNFDSNSDMARKNPGAVLEAFRLARAEAPQMHLVIKMMLPRRGEAPPEALDFRAMAGTSPNVHIIDGALSHEDLRTLFVSCDAYISLHRAEGLGLGMLEAMHLGLPVVATAYSGNMSFMNDQSACLVPYRDISVDMACLSIYKTLADLAATWADPDVDVAAGHLVRLANDPVYRAERGGAARAAARAWQREALEFTWLDQLTEIARDRQRRASIRRFTRLS